MAVGYFRDYFTLEVPIMEDTNEARCKSPNYVELIIDIVKNTNDEWILEQIYRYSKNMIKEG